MQLKKYLLREKPNYIITVPAHWKYFIKEDFDRCDLSFIKNVIVGGDTIKPSFRNKMEEIFEKCGCKSALKVGYGLSESTSTATSTLNDTTEGSVGFPFMHTLIKVVEKDTVNEMPPNEKGEICISGPTVCRGYFNDIQLTKKVIREHDDGRIWLHTGDCGYLDENGALFFSERFKRMYVRFDGTKISPYSIEQAVLNCDLVEDCMVIGIKDAEHSHGMCAKVFVVLKAGIRKSVATEQLKSFFKKHLDQHMIPKEIVFVEKIPRTKNGKIDYFNSENS